jgi:hypothetical protein
MEVAKAESMQVLCARMFFSRTKKNPSIRKMAQAALRVASTAGK